MIARYALFAVAIGFTGGALMRSLFILDVALVGFFALLALTLSIAWHLTRYPAYALTALFLLGAICGASRAMLVYAALPDAFQSLIGSTVSREGRVAAEPDVRETSQRITVAITEGRQEARVLAVVPLYPAVQYGERIRIVGDVEAPKPFVTENGRTFRYDRHLAKDGIFLIIPRASVESLSPPPLLDAYTFGLLYRIKASFIRGIEDALPEPSAALAEGILVGGKQGLGSELLDAFTVAGLIHVVVLSGYNIMLVARGFLAVLGKGRRVGQIAAGIAILLFVLMAGAGSASVRAGLMAGLALFARASGRTYEALRALAAVTLLMLLHNPLLIAFDVGFQFTLAATIGVITLTPILERCLSGIRPAFLREIAATTMAAQIGILPILLYQTGLLSPYALPANLIALSVIPLAMLLSFIAGVAGMVLPVAAPVIALPAHLLLMFVVVVAESVAWLPGARVVIPAFSIWFVIVAYAALIWLAFRLRPSIKGRSFNQ